MIRNHAAEVFTLSNEQLKLMISTVDYAAPMRPRKTILKVAVFLGSTCVSADPVGKIAISFPEPDIHIY